MSPDIREGVQGADQVGGIVSSSRSMRQGEIEGGAGTGQAGGKIK